MFVVFLRPACAPEIQLLGANAYVCIKKGDGPPLRHVYHPRLGQLLCADQGAAEGLYRHPDHPPAHGAGLCDAVGTAPQDAEAPPEGRADAHPRWRHRRYALLLPAKYRPHLHLCRQRQHPRGAGAYPDGDSGPAFLPQRRASGQVCVYRRRRRPRRRGTGGA